MKGLPVRGPGRRRSPRTPRRHTRFLDRSRILSALLMAGSAAAIYGIANAQAFTLRVAEIDAGTLTGRQALTAAIGLPDPLPNVFRIETDRIRDRLATLPGVVRAEVSVVLPGTLRVHLVEREAVLVWGIGEARFLVDRDGYVIGDAASADATDVARTLAGELPVVLDRRADVALAAAEDATIRAAQAAAAGTGDEATPDEAGFGPTAANLGPVAPSPTPASAKASKSPKPSSPATKGAKASPSPKPKATQKPKATGKPSPTPSSSPDPEGATVVDGSVPDPTEEVAGATGGPVAGATGGPAPSPPPSAGADAPADEGSGRGTAVAPRIDGVPLPGETLGAMDLDIATRLLSLAPADVGSAAPGLRVIIDPVEGWTLRPVDGEPWVAVFGLYAPEIRKPAMIPSQVRVLRSLLIEIGETHVKRIVLTDPNGGTYTERR